MTSLFRVSKWVSLNKGDVARGIITIFSDASKEHTATSFNVFFVKLREVRVSGETSCHNVGWSVRSTSTSSYGWTFKFKWPGS